MTLENLISKMAPMTIGNKVYLLIEDYTVTDFIEELDELVSTQQRFAGPPPYSEEGQAAPQTDPINATPVRALHRPSEAERTLWENVFGRLPILEGIALRRVVQSMSRSENERTRDRYNAEFATIPPGHGENFRRRLLVEDCLIVLNMAHRLATQP